MRFLIDTTIRGCPQRHGTGTEPFINFQPVPESKVGKVRLHLDVLVDDVVPGWSAPWRSAEQTPAHGRTYREEGSSWSTLRATSSVSSPRLPRR
jgi:hypothetical protein